MLFGRMVHPPKSSANNATAAAAATAAGAMMAAASAASCWFGTRAATSSSVSCSSRALSSQSSSSSSSSSYFARTCWLRTQQSGLVGGLQQFHPLSSWGRPTAHRLFGAPFPSSRTTAVSSGSRRFSSSSSSSSSNSSSSSSSSSSFMAWYEDKLLRAPVLTKMMTGLCLWSVGDAVAQLVPPMTGQGPPLEQYDYARTGRAAFFGFALHAPTSHVHYNFLEWMTVQGGFKGLQIPVFKTIMEQFVYWSWISNSLYHAAMGAMQGMNGDQIVQRIQDVLWDTQKAQWVFWIPVQLLNFYYIPVRHQLNVVLLTSIVWTALLSAWYPPQKPTPTPKTTETTVPDAAEHNAVEPAGKAA